MRAGFLQDIQSHLIHEQIVQYEFRRQRQLAQDSLHRGANIFACGLPDLDVDVDRAVLPAAVQFVLQRQQG